MYSATSPGVEAATSGPRRWITPVLRRCRTAPPSPDVPAGRRDDPAGLFCAMPASCRSSGSFSGSRRCRTWPNADWSCLVCAITRGLPLASAANGSAGRSFTTGATSSFATALLLPRRPAGRAATAEFSPRLIFDDCMVKAVFAVCWDCTTAAEEAATFSSPAVSTPPVLPRPTNGEAANSCNNSA